MSHIGIKILKGTAVLSVVTLMAKAMGFVEKVVIAGCFGTGVAADAYMFAFKRIVLLLFVIPRELLAPFLPIFVEERERNGEARAWDFAKAVAVILSWVLAALVVTAMIFAPQIVRLVSSFPEETTALTVRLVRIMLPAGLFMGLFALAALAMQSYKRFALPAFGEVANKVVMVCALVALYRLMGIRGLAVGVVAGALVSLGIQVCALWPKIRLAARGVDFRTPALATMGRLIPPILLGTVVAQLRIVLDGSFASAMGPGCVSSLDYARGITDSMSMLVPVALGVVVYPYFSDLVAKDDKEGLVRNLMGSMRVVALIFIPISVALIVLRYPVVALAFQRGKFPEESVALTAWPLLFYALGLAPFAVEILLMRFYFAMKDMVTPVAVGIGCVAVHVCVILALREGWLVHGSIALAATVSKTVKIVVLYFLLCRKLPRIEVRENLLFVVKALAAAAIMAAAVYGLDHIAKNLIPAGYMAGALKRAAVLTVRLGVCALAGFVVFAGASILLRMNEARLVVEGIRRRPGRRGEEVGGEGMMG